MVVDPVLVVDIDFDLDQPGDVAAVTDEADALAGLDSRRSHVITINRVLDPVAISVTDPETMTLDFDGL